MNLLSDFFTAKDGGRIPEDKAKIAKIGAFCKDVYEVKAVMADGCSITLGEKGAKLEDVDFVAGLWRVQKNFPYEITRVRDKDVVLMNKLPHQENTNFEYWDAKLVGYNCYGPFVLQGKDANLIVAKYDTDEGCIWGYGTTIESARAFLGLKLYDMYKDVIHSIACKNKFIAKDDDRIPEDKTETAKTEAFYKDVYKVKAITADGRNITLGKKGAKLENVDFVAGLWRVQKKFPHKITRVRDKDVVLTDKLSHQESTNFEYWNAKLVGYNCYGPFVLQGKDANLIVTKYGTDDGYIWGYGSTIESARAFLGVKLYDMYKDTIHLIACKNKLKQK